MNEKESLLDNTVVLDVLAIIKQELSNLGCRLKDYYVKFSTTGFDITKVKIDVSDPQRIIDVLKEADPSVRHEFRKAPSKYAFMAANVEVSRRVQDELGLDYKAVGFADADRVALSISEPVAEKPLPPSEITPTDIAGDMGDVDFSGGELGEEPGEADVEAAVGGGGGMGGLGGGGGMGSITPLPVGGAGGAEGAGAETGAEGGEENLLPGEEPGGVGEEFPEAPGYEEGAPEGEEEALPPPGKKMKKPGREY